MKLFSLVQTLKEKEILFPSNPEISGLTYDSRQIRPGCLFAAIKGTAVDGHRFLKEAVEKKAAALLVERPLENCSTPQIIVHNTRKALAECADVFYGHPAEKLKLVGVTGTNGKTTTTYLCDSIFSQAGFKTGIIGTIQYKIGDRIQKCKNTTPESLDLYQMFTEMVESGVDACSMEVSSHALDQGRVHGILFDTVVFTNLTQDHLDYHKTMEAYFEAKSKLFTEILPNKNPKAVINSDDPYGQRLLRKVKIPCLTYGIHQGEVRAKELSLEWKGVSFTVLSPIGEFKTHLAISGKFNVYNALAAISTGIALNIPIETIQKGIETAEQVRGRFEQIHEGQDFSVIVDYAHTPDGLENLLKSAKELTKGNLIVVFGCGGDRDRGKRPLMGKIAENYGDILVITSDNPRTEDPLSIIREIEAGIKQKHEVEPDRKKAIELALTLAKPGDCVVIAGKGHETYQIFKDKTIHFDDREIVRNFFQSHAVPQSS